VAAPAVAPAHETPAKRLLQALQEQKDHFLPYGKGERPLSSCTRCCRCARLGTAEELALQVLRLLRAPRSLLRIAGASDGAGRSGDRVKRAAARR